MKKELVFGIFVLLLLFTAFMVFRKPTPTAPPTDSKGITITNNYIKENSSSINYSIDVTYPQIEGFSNKISERAVNITIENNLKKNVDNFKTDMNTALQNTKLPASLRKSMNQYIVTYQATEATDNIASFHFTNFESIVGMAHPVTTNTTFTYDMQKNMQITIKDLFKPNSNYLATLSNLSQKLLSSQIKASPFSKMMIQEGTKPVDTNFSLFTLSANTLTLYFNPSQVAPDAAGTQMVKIPLKDLSDILNIAQ